MYRIVHGVVHGKIIELHEDPGMAEGEQVEIILRSVGKAVGVSVCREKVWEFQGYPFPPATGSLQPEAIGAAVEVTKPRSLRDRCVALAMQRADRP
jgi:hypothetical protein